ncbi:MAG TPA: RagB/SusD family nutrient uptake outer membrane protein [Prolixibacteraceae bacterium]|nr:RagB/SusD family nutrient uptake outer membrane protein [Prolixibacteraceae bacterium]
MKKLISIAFASFIMMSCSKDFIELSPVSAVSVDIVYKTDKDFSDALTATYNSFQSAYRDRYIIGDIRADDSWQEISKSNSQSYSDLFTTSSSDGLLNSQWQYFYTAIFRVNTILTKIEPLAETTIPKKARYIAEAKFLRALAYFDLVRIFGDVPMVTHPLSIEEGYKIPREPVANIYSKIIIPDLLAAETGLLAKYTGADVGRPTIGAAKAILGKVYLTIKDFQKTEAKLLEVTTMGYLLLPKFTDLFDYTKNEHHSEYIFDIEHEEGMGEGSPWNRRFAPNNVTFTSFYGIGGNGDEQNGPTQILIDLFAANDLRKDITVGVRGGFIGANGVFVKLTSNTNQTYTKKYIVTSAAADDSKSNWKVIRYGDILLMLAEAMNENGKTDQAITYLNQIRARAGVTVYSTGMTQSAVRDAIVLERRLELSFEGHRWFDLTRTGQAYNVMKDYGMVPYMIVWPLPLSQVQLINDPTIFPQNPGYN